MARRMPVNPGVITKDKGLKSNSSKEKRLKHERVKQLPEDIRKAQAVARYEIRMGILNAERARQGLPPIKSRQPAKVTKTPAKPRKRKGKGRKVVRGPVYRTKIVNGIIVHENDGNQTNTLKG